jgi:hypothetical protein
MASSRQVRDSLDVFPRYGHTISDISHLGLLSSLLSPFKLSSSSTIRRRFLLFGGKVGDRLTNDLFQISISVSGEVSAQRLQTDSQGPSPRYRHAAVAYKTVLVVFGGISADEELDHKTYVLDIGARS